MRSYSYLYAFCLLLTLGYVVNNDDGSNLSAIHDYLCALNMPSDWFLVHCTATQYDRLLASFCCPSVCPSVCLSVCLSVMLCIVTLRVGVAAKSCTSVFLAGMFLFVCSDTFAVGCIVQPQNAPQKRSEKRHKCLMDSGTRVVYARLVCQQ